MREIWVQSLGWEDPLEKEMAIHSSTIAWKIPWTEEPGRLQSMGSQRVGHDWATSLSLSKGFMPRGTFQCAGHCGESLLTHAPTGDPLTLAGSFCSVSCRLTAPLPWVLVCPKFCLCPPSLESLFSPVLWKAYNQIILTFKTRLPGDSQSLYQISGLRSLTWGSEPLQ